MGAGNPIVRPVVRPVVGSVSNPFGLGPPFSGDLDQWLKGIDDNVFNEIKVPGANVAILPRIAVFNGTDDNVDFDSSINLGKSYTIIATLIPTDLSLPNWIVNGSSNLNGIFINNTTQVVHKAGNASVTFATSLLVLGNKYEIKIVRAGTVVKLYINGVQNGGDQVIVNNDCVLDGIANHTMNNFVGRYISLELQSPSDTTVLQMELKGNGGFEYDLTANVNHGTRNGSGTMYTYNEDGSTYPAQNGYALWQKDLSEDIQVPFDLTGAALVLTPGVDIPTGYEEKRDLNGETIRWNIADALFGMNETGLANAIYEIWDRLNATRQTPFSRDSIYYDATSLATRSRYHVSEITDPLIYSQLFEVGYKGRVFAKVVVGLDGTVNVILLYIEELNYGTDKIGIDEWKVMKYCGIEDYALLGDGSQPIYDDNDYVIIAE